MLTPEQQAWLRYRYAYDLNYEGQVVICRFVMKTFENGETGKGTSAKVWARLRRLIWLAVQQSAGTLGREDYAAIELAELVGVKAANWSKHYAARWREVLCICSGLDGASLESLSKRRHCKA